MLQAAEKKLCEADVVLNVGHFLIVRKVKIRNTKTEKQDHILMWVWGPTVERSSTDPDPSHSRLLQSTYERSVFHPEGIMGSSWAWLSLIYQTLLSWHASHTLT